MSYNLSVQVTARAEPLWKIIVNLKNYNIYGKSVEALAAPDFCVVCKIIGTTNMKYEIFT